MRQDSIKTLLIEDNPGDVRLIQGLLAEARDIFDLDHVESLGEARQYLNQNTPDAILLDLGLPDSSGLDTLDHVLEETDAPVIVLTGLKDEDTALHTVRKGAQDYLIKGETSASLLSRTIQYSIERKKTKNELRETRRALQERVKELNCHYNISMLIERNISLEEIFQGVVDLLPLSWQYPDCTCACISMRDEEYTSDPFKETAWNLSSPLIVNGDEVGTVGVYYMCEDCEEDPFLLEEQNLLDAIANRLGDVIERQRAEERIEHLNSLLMSIRNVNQIIVQESDLEEIMQKTCSALVETRSYLGCAIALLDNEKEQIVLTAQKGDHQFAKRWSVTTDGEGSAPTCVKETLNIGDLRVIDTKDCGSCSYKDKIDGHQAIVVPMKRRNETVGLLHTCIKRGVQIDKDERNLLLEVANDLTFSREKIKAEEELRKSEKKYRELFKSVQVGIVVHGPEGEILSANPTAEEALGLQEAQLQEKDLAYWKGKLYKENGEPMEVNEFPISKVYASNQPEEATVLGIASQDAERIKWYIHSAVPHFNEKGEIESVITSFKDITKQKKMKETLRENKQKIEHLHNVAAEMESIESKQEVYDCIIDAAQRILEFDTCTVAIAEGDFLTIKVTSYDDIPEENTMPISEGVIGRSYRKGRSYIVKDLRQDKDARPSSEEFRSCISVPLQKIGVFIAISNEIGAFTKNDLELAELLVSHATETLNRIQSEKALKESEERYRRLFETAQDGMLILDASSGEIIDANPFIRELVGHSKGELKGKHLWDIGAFKDIVENREKFIELKEKGSIRYEHLPLRTKRGKEVSVEFVSNVYKAGGKKMIQYDIRDITERKKVEEQRERAREEAEFYADILAHDMGNLNQIMLGYLYLLKDADEKEAIEKNVERVKKAIIKAKKLAESIQILKKIREEPIERIDLGNVLEQSIKRLHEYFDRKIEISLRGDECDVNANVFLDEALFNVLENAVEFTLHDPVRIDITVRGSDGMCMVSIRDHGIGISEKKRKDILHNLETLSKRTGMGLYLAKKIVESYDGSLDIIGKDNGTEVVLSIPEVGA